MDSIPLKRKQVAGLLKATFPDYEGRKIKIQFQPSITFWDTNWSGGTRSQYVFVMADGRQIHLPVNAPWGNPAEGAIFEIPADVIVVQHSMFCGQDMGITLYANPVNLPHWIDAPGG